MTSFSMWAPSAILLIIRLAVVRMAEDMDRTGYESMDWRGETHEKTRFVIPREHGGWAMVSVPYIIGMAAAKPVLLHLPLFWRG